ncbi:DUF3046 domain-containing protein [Georgenia sp. Z1344]|uniref:DUF3046 domain-containing protein n=1 Tax=Georgenia sp. Z1344 TaxID=3416706 RepID=UPI003CF1E9D5
MKRSQFTAVAREVLGEATASSYLADLTLAGVGYRTANEALEQGVRPQDVWDAMVDELGLPDSARWHHRREIDE